MNKPIRISTAAACGALVAAAAGAALAQAQPQFVRGVVKSLQGDRLTIGQGASTITVRLSPKVGVMTVRPATAKDIRPGSFIGTTNVPTGPDAGRSTEVHIFPPGMRMGEGDRPMGGGGSRMTNGAVASVGAENATRMTNGAVGSMSGGPHGVQLTVQYKGGMRHIVVPPNVPVMAMVSAGVAQLKPGTLVDVGVVKAPDGTRTATFVNIEPPHPAH